MSMLVKAVCRCGLDLHVYESGKGTYCKHCDRLCMTDKKRAKCYPCDTLGKTQ